MSASRVEICLPYIFHGEGGYTNDRRDKGNWTGGVVGKGVLKGTKYGIAASSFPNLDIKNLTKEQAAEIYRKQYWSTAGCDALPVGVDLPIFDVSVNSGPSRGKQFAQETATTPPVAWIKAISARRRKFYQGLSTFKTYGKGWLSRVATIEAAALKMALAAGGASPVAIKNELLTEAKSSENKVKTTTVATGGSVATAGTAGATAGFDWLTLGLGAAAVAVALVIVIHFVRAQSVRSEALKAEAAIQ